MVMPRRKRSEVVTEPVAVIEPPQRWPALNLRELWHARELIFFLGWRDVKIRYSQAVIGVAWAVLQPVLMMVLFTLVLGRLAKVPSEGLPYPVFALSGLLPWTFFANAVGSSTESLVTSSNLVAKVYFPRLVIPIAALMAWVPDLGFASVTLAVVMLFYGLVPAVTAILLPVFAAFALLAAASVSVWLSSLNARYRDVRHAVPFLLQLWLFATPVLYPATLVPPRYRPLLGLNPMSGAVEGFRWSLLGTGQPQWGLMAVSAAVCAVLLVGGLFHFRRMETSFADVI